MAIGREEHQVLPLVMLVVTIPMRQLDVFFALDHLPTARAKPVLLSQELSTKRRRRTQRQCAVALLEVCLPGRVKGIYPLPDEGVQLGEGLATDSVAMIIRPTPQAGGAGIDELRWRGTPGLLTEDTDLVFEGLIVPLLRPIFLLIWLTEGADLVFEGLGASRAGGELEFGWLTSGPLRFTYGLP
jgi:hypothetical protein